MVAPRQTVGVDELIEKHAEYVPLALLGTAVAGGLLVAALWPVVPRATLLTWSALLVVPFAARASLVRWHGRTPDALSPAQWLSGFRATFVVHALVWAAASRVLFVVGDILHQVLLAFVVSALAASSLATAAFDRVAGLAFLFVAGLPLGVQLLVADGSESAMLGVFVAVFLGFMAMNGQRVHRHYVENAEFRRLALARAEALAGFQAALGRLAIRAGSDPNSVLRATADELQSALRLRRVWVARLDLAGGTVVVDAASGVDAPAVGDVAGVHAARLLAGLQSAEPGAPIPDAAVQDPLSGTRLALTAGMHRLDVPVGTHGQVDRILCCERAAAGWTDDERTFVTAVAARLHAAGEEMRRREAEQRLRDLNRDLEQLVASRTQALGDSEERFRAVFDHSPVALTLLDAGRRTFTEVNEAAIAVLGYSRQEFLQLSPKELGAWDNPEAAAQALAAVDRDGRLRHWETELRRKNGTSFPAVMHFSNLTVGGAPFRMAAIEDVTEQRQLQHAAMQAQKMEVVGHLAGGVAHDFNNVLTVISSTAELALDSVRTGLPVDDALQTIHGASTRAAQLTGRLLAFARQQILQPAVLDLNTVVEGVMPMIRGVVGDAVVTAVRVADAPCLVTADRASLEQVVLNLAINARDAMPSGGTLSIAVDAVATCDTAERRRGTTPSAGGCVRLTIRDTGIGMSAATRERIFEPFFTTKDVGSGTGLGLSMVHGVVSQSGGEIAVESAPGQGTTFTIVFPAASGAPALEAPRHTPMLPGSEVVLVVDDDADIREMLRRSLRHAGYEVLVAPGAHEALRVLDEIGGRAHLLLTDVMMAGMDGRALADAARARYPQLRVLFSSGYAEHAIARHGVLAEGVEFIAKPYSLQALAQKVRDVLDR